MTRLLALLATSLIFLSGCVPTSMAQAIDDVDPIDVSEESASSDLPRLASSQPEAAQPKSVPKVKKLPVPIHKVQEQPESEQKPQAPPEPEQQAQESAESEQTAQEPPRLWMDMSMGAELMEWFNETAHPVDVARVDHVSRIDLLENVKVGRRLVVFKNVADAEELLPHLADRMDIIGYNLEHGPANRPDEQADPVGSARRMRALADEYGLELALGPDRSFALSDGVAMAPYVDMFVMQIQRAQTEPDVVREFVLPLAAQLRAVNPDLEISVQVRTEGDPVAIADLVKSMEGSLDGVSILTNDESTNIAQAIVAELRPVDPEVPTPSPLPSSTPRDAQFVALPTSTPAPRRTSTASAVPALATVSASTTQHSDPQDGWLFAGGIAALGILIAGLLTTLTLYAFRSIRYR